MIEVPPILFVMHDGALRPASKRNAELCAAHYRDGERYAIIPWEARSRESHNHQFAELNSIWESLPDVLAELYPTPEVFRKHGLIRTGWCNSQTEVFASKAVALRVAALLRPLDEFSIVDVRGATVTRYTAKSQSMRAMGREDFQKSKQDVLDWAASLIGVTPKALSENARESA